MRSPKNRDCRSRRRSASGSVGLDRAHPFETAMSAIALVPAAGLDIGVADARRMGYENRGDARAGLRSGLRWWPVWGHLGDPIVLNRHFHTTRGQAVPAEGVHRPRHDVETTVSDENRTNSINNRSLGAALRLSHGPVFAATGQQFLMAAAFDDLARLHHQDDVRVADRRKPVSDDETRSITPQLAHGVLDQKLGTGVHGAGGLVENEQLRTGKERAGDGDQLLLACADVAAVVADQSSGSRRAACARTGRRGRPGPQRTLVLAGVRACRRRCCRRSCRRTARCPAAPCRCGSAATGG